MKYEYVHGKFNDLDQAVSYAHTMGWRIVGFCFTTTLNVVSYTDRGEWHVIFEKNQEIVS